MDVPQMARTRDIAIARARKQVREGTLDCVHEVVPRNPERDPITVEQELAGDTVTAVIFITSIENKRSAQKGGRTMLATLENFWEQATVSEALYGSPGHRYATQDEISQAKADDQARLDQRIIEARHLSWKSDNRFGKLAG